VWRAEVSQMTNESLREAVPEAIRSGRLPSRRPNRTFDESRYLIAIARELVRSAGELGCTARELVRTTDDAIARSKVQIEKSRGRLDGRSGSPLRAGVAP
jgi:hypothetical protein